MDQSSEIVDPLSIYMNESELENESSAKGYFITGTDTEVGKTIVTAVLGILLREKGIDVGVMKPVQCSGHDATFLKRILNLNDDVKDINPYYSPEALSPHLAFERKKIRVHTDRIIKIYDKLKQNHDMMLVEGAGGLLVPIKRNFLMADLIKELGLELLIVSRPGLGTVNHTLMTIEQARAYGITIRGVIFSQSSAAKEGIPEKTNPDVIRKFGRVPILGKVPYMKPFNEKEIIKKCGPNLNISRLLSEKKEADANVLEEWDKQHVWHPYTQMKDWADDKPLIIDEADGCYLKDTEGNRYLDGVSSLWVNVHGHNNRKINRAVVNQVNKVSHTTLLGLSNTPSIQLARKLTEITPKGLEKVFYSDSGSTAVEVAIKMSYQYWQNMGKHRKTKIVHMANSYHGDTLGSVSVGGITLFHRVYRNLTFPAIKMPFPDCYRSPSGKTYPDYAFEYVDKLEDTFKKSHHSIASMIVEPGIQGAAGMIVWPKGVLKKVDELCRKYKILLILDEVATGFGRTGKMFACEHESVSPDIMCLAKGITGGYLPLAATLTTQSVYDGFLHPYKDQKTFFHGHTYTGNPLACAAALANIEVFEKERVLTKLQPKIKYLSNRLKMFYNLSSVGDVRQMGFMVGIELVADKNTKEPYPWDQEMGVKVCRKVREKGVILRPLGNVIVIMPPLAINTKELDQILNAVYEAIKKITENDKPNQRRK